MEEERMTRLGRYEIIDEIGRGAMGIVYLGRDPRINRSVALKCLRGNLVDGKSGARRFQQEMRALGRLIHPNIVTIFDAGEDRETGLSYIVMEYVAGPPLIRLIRNGTVFPPGQVVEIGLQICGGLDFAHTKGVIHRDIKPGNILYSGDRQTVKITDFGIARLDRIGLTQTDRLTGTPQYMSPEQARGETLDGRSDLFSVGVLLYELLTGEKPFKGESLTAVMHQVLNHTPYPPLRRVAGYSGRDQRRRHAGPGEGPGRPVRLRRGDGGRPKDRRGIQRDGDDLSERYSGRKNSSGRTGNRPHPPA